MGGRLEQLTGPAAAIALGDDATVLVPIGAIEQHGPHLPLSVDWIIADAVAQAVVDRAGDELPIWLLPTMPFSKSNEHAWSKGTIWLSQQTMMHVLDDIGRCVAESGAKRIAFLNGHGGNSTLLNVVCRELRLSYGLLTFLVHPFVPPADSPPDPDAANGLAVTSRYFEVRIDVIAEGLRLSQFTLFERDEEGRTRVIRRARDTI